MQLVRDNLTGQMSENQALKFELECNTASARLLRSECDHFKEELNKVTGVWIRGGYVI